MSAPRIVIGFHSYGQCPTQFAVDLAKTMRYCGTAIPLALHEQSCYVDSARNRLVKQFLAMPPQEATHLLMVDVDISFESHYPMLTYEVLHSMGADAVYGNYALGNSGNSIFGPPDNIAQESAVLVGLKPNHIYTDIATGGTGWVMMTRELLERMQRECPGPWHWFARDITSKGDDLRGEDISFGLRMWGMNPRPRVIATTALVLRHMKNQPFIPEFQQHQAAALGLNSLCFPNPYEHDKEKFIIHQNRVLEKKHLSQDQIQQIEALIAKEKEAEDAVGRGHEQVFIGQASEREQEGAQGPQQEAGHSDNAERKEESQSREEGVPAEAN